MKYLSLLPHQPTVANGPGDKPRHVGTKRYALRITHYALVVFLAIFLAACGEETPPAPALATATPAAPAPFVETPLPSPTAVTLGRPPATPVPPTPKPTVTASAAALESNYVGDATRIVTGIINAPEITDAINASGDAVANALFGTVDVNALTDKLEKAAGVVNDAGEKFAALTPPPAYKSTHERFIAVFTKYGNAFDTAEKAVSSGDWFSLASSVSDIVTATDELSTLLSELTPQ